MENRPNIFEYLDFRQFLRDLFAHRKRESATFSHRNFSRLAGLRSTNFLKLVMDGKRNLSIEAVARFAKAFRLNKSETEFFECLVLFNQARSLEEKNRFYERIGKSKSYRSAKALEAHQYDYFSQWYHVALRELVTVKNFKEEPKWINKRLRTRLTPDEIRHAFRILLELRLLFRDEKGKLRQTDGKIISSPELGALAVLNFHREMMRKARESLDHSSESERDVSALTVAITKRQFEEIRDRLNQVRREIHEIGNGPGEKEAVYQVNLQLFNLSEVPWR